MSDKNKVLDHILNFTPPAKTDTPSAPEPSGREAVEKEKQARTHPAMLCLCFRNGDEVLISYSLFRRATMREGGTKWELVFDDCTVVVTGRNLGDKLRDHLRLQKLSMLREGNQIEGELMPEDQAFIDSIELREKEDEA